jgi:hypothetical protein
LNKIVPIVVGALALLFVFPACSSIPFVAQSQPTATPTTRRIRPTFTPKPQASPTKEITPTEEPPPATEAPTEEPQATNTPVPVTPKPTTKPAVRQPTNPPPPPAPQFAVKFNTSYLCEQQGIYKVIISAKRGNALMAGATFAIFDQGGNLLQDAAGKKLIGVTQGDFNVSIGSNCRAGADRVHPNTSNGELEVGDAVRAGNNPIIIRFVKSADDLTPISENLSMNFGSGGQYWVYANSQ